MNSLLLFLIKSTLSLSLLYLTFSVLMRKETFFKLNRMVLLVMVLSSLLIPLLYLPQPIQPFAQTYTEPIFRSNSIPAQPVQTSESPVSIPSSVIASETSRPVAISIQTILFFIYLSGVIISFLMLIYSICSVLLLFRRARRMDHKGYRLMIVDNELAAFSFGHTILISQHDYDTNSESIITHEQSHIRLGHFYDLMLLELVKVIFWFNPLVYRLTNDLKEIHEFQADDCTLNQGIDATKYQLLIIQKSVGHQKFALANSFNHCQIKNRITMMNKQKTSKAGLWKVATFLPLLALLLMAFGKTGENVQLKNVDSPSVIQENQKDPPFFSIELRKDGNYFNNRLCSLDDLSKEKKTFERYNPTAKSVIRFITQGGVSIPLSRFNEIYDILGRQNPNLLMMNMNNADHQAEFTGGTDEMFKWLIKNVNYPNKALSNRLQGEVLVNFLVSDDGKVKRCMLFSYNDSELNAEALRVVSNMPTWKPATKDGIPVTVDYTVPIVFRIK